jgi:hypothetical protein
VFEQIYVPSSRALEVSSLRADMERFNQYIGQKSEYKLDNAKGVIESVIDNYIMPINIDFKTYRQQKRLERDVAAKMKKSFEDKGIKSGDEYIQICIKFMQAESDIKNSVKFQRTVRRIRYRKKNSAQDTS